MRPLIVVMLITGCVPHTAIVDGVIVQRPTLGYTDHRYFAIEHRDAYPRPLALGERLTSYAGRVNGVVCGAQVSLDGDYYGRHLDVSGVAWPTAGETIVRHFQFFVEDRAGARHITGKGADIELTPTTLSGSITFGEYYQQFHLSAVNDDDLIGVMEIYGVFFPYAMRGRHALWSMPAEDQATLLPFMLTCRSHIADDDGTAMWGIDFRGIR